MRSHVAAVLLFVGLALGACADSCAGAKLPKLPKIDLASLELPRDKDGDVVLFEAAKSTLAVRPTLRDALTVVGGCTDLVTHCYAPPASSLDDCVARTPACATAKPWQEPDDCCPVACQESFVVKRQAGLGDDAAFTETFFSNPSCFPGVDAALEAP